MVQISRPRPAAPDVDLVLGDMRQIRLRIWKMSDGARFAVGQLHRGGGPLPAGAVVRLYSRRRVREVDPWPVSWSMVRGLPPSRRCRDSVVDLVRHAGQTMFGFRRERTPGNEGDEMTAYASQTMTAVRAAVRDAAIHAADRCDVGLRKIALRFLPSVRYRIYRYMVDDRTGRVAQLAMACPGAVVFGAGLRREDWSEAVGRQLFADTVAGVSLPRLLRRAAEGWFRGGFASGRAQIGFGREEIIWQRIAVASATERQEICATTCLLVHRARPRVPPGIDLEIRAAARGVCPRKTFRESPSTCANACWYRVMKGAAPLLTPPQRHERAAPQICPRPPRLRRRLIVSYELRRLGGPARSARGELTTSWWQPATSPGAPRRRGPASSQIQPDGTNRS